jgi:hypothetical protein
MSNLSNAQKRARIAKAPMQQQQHMMMGMGPLQHQWPMQNMMGNVMMGPPPAQWPTQHMMGQQHVMGFQPMMMPQPQMQGQGLGQQMPQMQGRPAQQQVLPDEDGDDDLEGEECDEDDDDANKYNKGADAHITSSAKLLKSLPKGRLSEAVEAVDNRFDATVTADLSVHSLAKLLWLLTRVKPMTRVCTLRVKSYTEMYKLFRTANTRLMARMSQFRYEEEVLKPITAAPDDAIIDSVSASMGFQAEWLLAKGKTNPGAGPSTGIQVPITSMFASATRDAGSVAPTAPVPMHQMQQQPAILGGLTAVSKAAPPLNGQPAAAKAVTPVPPLTMMAAVPEAQAAPTAVAPVATAVAMAVGPVTMTTSKSQMQGMLAQLQPAELHQLMMQMAGQLQCQQAEPVIAPDDQPPSLAPQNNDAQLPQSGAQAESRDTETPMCAFCQHDIATNTGEALQCGHVFHATCLMDYMSATGKVKGACCPYKCSATEQEIAAFATFEALPQAPAASSSDVLLTPGAGASGEDLALQEAAVLEAGAFN